jgi:hypothetical protein
MQALATKQVLEVLDTAVDSGRSLPPRALVPTAVAAVANAAFLMKFLLLLLLEDSRVDSGQ